VVIQELHNSSNIKSRSSTAVATSDIQSQTPSKAKKPSAENRGGKIMIFSSTFDL